MSQEVKLLTKKFLSISDSRYQFNKLLAGLKEEFKPEGFYENLLVDKLTTDYLRLKKALVYEKDHLFQDEQAGNPANNNKISQVTVYIKSIEKSIENGIKAIKEAKNKTRLGNCW